MCCETNHLGHDGHSKMKCSRKNVKIVLDRMIEAKANHLFMFEQRCIWTLDTSVEALVVAWS